MLKCTTVFCGGRLSETHGILFVTDGWQNGMNGRIRDKWCLLRRYNLGDGSFLEAGRKQVCMQFCSFGISLQGGEEDMLIVFDLDFTLWDAGGTWCDHTLPPYHRHNGWIMDAEGRRIELYPDVRSILSSIRGKGLPMALASRTHSPSIASRLLDMLGISEYFEFRQIYPGSKIRHFEMLKKETGQRYESMIFFDDEYRNVQEVSGLGVQTCLVGEGLTWHEIEGARVPL